MQSRTKPNPTPQAYMGVPIPWDNPAAAEANRKAAEQAANETITIEQANALKATREADLPVLQTLWSSDAATTRAKMAVYLDHGFTREEAFAIVMKDWK